MRRPLIAGNWKMNKTVEESISFAKEFKNRVKEASDRDILICPSFISVHPLHEVLKESNVYIGAQNMHYETNGAYTGEVSPLMVKNAGCKFVILGHSERRHIFGETDELINKKVISAVSHNLIPILCVGEKLEDREAAKTFDVIKEQLTEGLKNIPSSNEIVIAYEPVWAIGTGKSATPEIAEDVHSFIRKKLAEIFDEEKADSIRILYGGSVKPENVASLMNKENIDGVLVGGASLKVDSFTKIVNFNKEA